MRWHYQKRGAMKKTIYSEKNVVAQHSNAFQDPFPGASIRTEGAMEVEVPRQPRQHQ